MIEFNYKDETVFSPTVIVSSKTDFDQGVIQFINNDNKVFPMLSFEVNNHRFKALLDLSPNETNHFKVEFWGGAVIQHNGTTANKRYVTEEAELKLNFIPMSENKPVHMCVILGKDSKGKYDMPKYKLNRGEKANLDTAIQRLKVAGRMMQAFTLDDFHHLKLGNRTFQFVEESTKSQQIYGINKKSSVAHSEVKVHVLRSPKTMDELRDPDWAQQNKKSKEEGGLFRHALEVIDSSDIFEPYKKKNTSIQCAVMFLDSIWEDGLIKGHASLGGGSDQVRLAIFGSHGLHSFPLTFPLITPSFKDDIMLSKEEVANDSERSGTPWECMNTCMGSFMHEFGYMFGSVMQAEGIMQHGYLWWNRLFMTRELRSLRQNSSGQLIGEDGKFPQECHWNIMDITRFLYHDSFSIPSDLNDTNFKKSNVTLMKPGDQKETHFLHVDSPGQVTIRSTEGMFLVEFIGENISRHHIKFHPKSYGGPGAPLQLSLNFEDCLKEFRKNWKESAENFDLRITTTAGEIWEPDFEWRSHPGPDSVIEDDFHLGKGIVTGIKGRMLGSLSGNIEFVGFDMSRVFKVRVYHGLAIDGLMFFSHARKENRMKRLERKFLKRQWFTNFYKPEINSEEENKDSSGEESLSEDENLIEVEEVGNVSHEDPYQVEREDDEVVMIGAKNRQYNDFRLLEGESIIRFSCRCGVWFDSVNIETDWIRSSGIIGNASGGGPIVLDIPSSHRIVGVYGCGYGENQLYGFGIIFARS